LRTETTDCISLTITLDIPYNSMEASETNSVTVEQALYQLGKELTCSIW
jgi:hypothetical protein